MTKATVGALLAAASVSLLAALAGPTEPATAHPFGPPSTAILSADGPRVHIDWRAAEDDWVALGQSLGAFEDPSTGSVETGLTGEQKLQRSTAVRDYLTDRIRVNQSGQPCRGTLLPLEELLTDGARVRFECPQPVDEIEVMISTLTDLNPAYRTVLTAESSITPAKALFTSNETSHDLRRSAAGAGGAAAVTTVAVGTAAAAAGGVALLVMRYRRTGRTQ